MIIGVGVEGPSDRKFWDSLLHREFTGHRFAVRAMNGRSNLIRETPRLLDNFHKFGCASGVILVDSDHSDKCGPIVLDEFADNIRQEALRPVEARFLFVCVAVKDLEAWYLADEVAIRKVFGQDSNYHANNETGEVGSRSVIESLWKKKFGGTALNKIELARQIVKHFDPVRAAKHSASFAHCWSRLKRAADAVGP